MRLHPLTRFSNVEYIHVVASFGATTTRSRKLWARATRARWMSSTSCVRTDSCPPMARYASPRMRMNCPFAKPRFLHVGSFARLSGYSCVNIVDASGCTTFTQNEFEANDGINDHMSV